MEILIKAMERVSHCKNLKNYDGLKMTTIITIKNNVYMSAEWKKVLCHYLYIVTFIVIFL